MNLSSNLNIRLLEGFSINLSGSVSRIHDQLALRRGDLSQEDVLLHRRQLSTQYSYYGSIGLRYTFGSIFSNVVNPRLVNPRLGGGKSSGGGGKSFGGGGKSSGGGKK